ncbi:hypothetical protein [Pseudomonas lactis]|uniref:hypothetical protein n=1 Tax=Pseudomonas lactis TaxID=1615674 RepID=UPI00070BA710|nr:hypothetical protein [Pseudomonas lactis]
MTYVREQTSTELAAHIRSLQKMAGWFDPLTDRLWQEVEALQAELAGLKTGYEAYKRVNAELKQKVANLEICQTASLGMSGIIKCVAGELGFDAAGEDSAQDYLIVLARKASEFKAENEALRKDADKWKSVKHAGDQLLADEGGAAIWSACSRVLISIASELNSGRSVVTEEGVTIGDREIGDWRVTVERIDAAMGKGEKS